MAKKRIVTAESPALWLKMKAADYHKNEQDSISRIQRKDVGRIIGLQTISHDAEHVLGDCVNNIDLRVQLDTLVPRLIRRRGA